MNKIRVHLTTNYCFVFRLPCVRLWMFCRYRIKANPGTSQCLHARLIPKRYRSERPSLWSSYTRR